MPLPDNPVPSPQAAKGLAVLVGAGPGSPALVTLEATRWLKAAQVVIYDRLANPELLALCPPGAMMIYVGKTPGRHEMNQDQINDILVKKTAEGSLVVRLKGGDPFIFGRGGEEIDALLAAGLRFRVVPGITAAIAAGAYAGIPMTDRRCGTSLALVTGHEDPTKGSSGVNWGALAGIDTVVFYMGVANLPQIAAKLIEAGKDPQTPAAVVERATQPRQRTIVAPLTELPQVAATANIKPPTLIIVGKVAEMHERMAWFERLPLHGRTVLVTRSRQQASQLSASLAEQGADVIGSPTIEILSPEDLAPLDEAISRLDQYDWLVLTSPNGAQAVLDRLWAIGKDARGLGSAKIAVVGSGTAKVLEDRLIRADLQPAEFTTQSLTKTLADAIRLNNARPGCAVRAVPVRAASAVGVPPASSSVTTSPQQRPRILLARADIAPDGMADALRQAGAVVDDIIAYRTVRPAALDDRAMSALREGRVNWITFTSSSTVENFLALIGESKELLKNVKLAAIGPVTADTIRAHGLAPTVIAPTHTIDALVEAIMEHEDNK